MNRSTSVLMTIVLVTSGTSALAAKPTPTPAADKVVYQPRYEDPVLKQIEDADKAAEKSADEATAKIRAEQKARRDAEEKDRKVLRFDMTGVARPASPDAFAQAWHFPPQAQFLTGTCWSFASTSFFESEVFRLGKQRIKLSEIHTVYWEYVEKMRGFVRARGDQVLGEGSEANAVVRIWKQYGAVPEEVYPGVLAADGRHDHARLFAQIDELAQWVKQHDIWDEDRVLALTRAILDRELGPPPEHFSYQGKEHTPRSFVTDVLRLDLDAYVDVMSTLSLPFYARGEYKVPDNWWHDASYYNVPLDEWYAGIKRAVQGGFTVDIGGDTSEPGVNGFENAAVIPTFDIPAEYIDQNAREFRFSNHTSTDDHLIHLVGYAQAGGRDWFLIKDSARSSRWGKFAGYFFYREDYVKLKMLSYLVHRDAVPDILAKFK